MNSRNSLDINIVVNELTIEINPVHPIPPLIDLTKFSSFLRVLRIMTRVLEFCQSPSNPFEKWNFYIKIDFKIQTCLFT